MIRSVTKFFYLSCFGVLGMSSLEAIPVTIELSKLESCFNQLSDPLLPLYDNPIVFGAMHNLKDLISWLKKEKPTTPFATALIQARDNFFVMQRDLSFDEASRRAIGEVLRILCAIPIPLLNAVPVRVPTITSNQKDKTVYSVLTPKKNEPTMNLRKSFGGVVKDDASEKGWTPFTSTFCVVSFIKALNKQQSYCQAPEHLNEQKTYCRTPGHLTVQTNFLERHSSDCWLIPSPFHSDLSPILHSSSSSPNVTTTSPENFCPISLQIRELPEAPNV